MTVKAHDVRKLRICAGCGNLAHADSAVALAGSRFPFVMSGAIVKHKFDLGSFFHVECFIEKYDEDHLLLLASDERAKIRLGDVSVETMRELLNMRV